MVEVLYCASWRRRLIVEGEGGHGHVGGRGYWSGPLVRWVMQVRFGVELAEEACRSCSPAKYM